VNNICLVRFSFPLIAVLTWDAFAAISAAFFLFSFFFAFNLLRVFFKFSVVALEKKRGNRDGVEGKGEEKKEEVERRVGSCID